MIQHRTSFNRPGLLGKEPDDVARAVARVTARLLWLPFCHCLSEAGHESACQAIEKAELM